ncbi:hypothetical protein ACYOEI_09100 [Singulisphaera rosea]
MSDRTSRIVASIRTMLVVGLSVLAVGCFQEDNEREFLKSAKPGVDTSIPGETYAQKKARTVRRTAIDRKAEKRRKSIDEKKAQTK